jgi:hypothetical protein
MVLIVIATVGGCRSDGEGAPIDGRLEAAVPRGK